MVLACCEVIQRRTPTAKVCPGQAAKPAGAKFNVCVRGRFGLNAEMVWEASKWPTTIQEASKWPEWPEMMWETCKWPGMVWIAGSGRPKWPGVSDLGDQAWQPLCGWQALQPSRACRPPTNSVGQRVCRVKVCWLQGFGVLGLNCLRVLGREGFRAFDCWGFRASRPEALRALVFLSFRI